MALIQNVFAIIAVLFGFLLVLPFLLVGSPFFGVAFLTRFFQIVSSRFSPKPVPWHKLIEYEPTIGWKPSSNMDTYVQVDGLYHVSTDADGWRGRTKLEDSDIIVFGDSYAFGYGVNDKHFFANINNDIRIKSIGVNGYNMVQELLWMQRLSDRLKGKLVVWFIYFGNDLLENLTPNLDHYRMPFVRSLNSTGQWEIVTDHVSPKIWTVTSKRKYWHSLAEICSRTLLADRAYSASEYLIKQGQKVCQKAEATLMVVTIPDKTQIYDHQIKILKDLSPDPDTFDPDLPDRNIGEICRKLSIPFVPLKNYLKVDDHKERDAHWNEKGHRRVSKVLAGIYRDHVRDRLPPANKTSV